jgi:hypothetical protein
LTNRATGSTGWSIAAEASLRGHEGILLTSRPGQLPGVGWSVEPFDDFNDLYIKLKKPDLNFYHDERIKRSIMSVIFLVLFTLPFVLDVFNVSDLTRLFLYRLGFMLWAQIFLLDAFMNYRQTQSRKWLVITNMAALLIIVGAFAH